MEILKDKIKEFLALDTGSGYGHGRAEGMAIKEVMSSYPPVTTHDDILKKLGLRAIVSSIPFRPTQLSTHEGKYYFVFTDDLVVKCDQNNDEIELITEEDAKRLIGFKDERVDYSKI